MEEDPEVALERLSLLIWMSMPAICFERHARRPAQIVIPVRTIMLVFSRPTIAADDAHAVARAIGKGVNLVTRTYRGDRYGVWLQAYACTRLLAEYALVSGDEAMTADCERPIEVPSSTTRKRIKSVPAIVYDDASADRAREAERESRIIRSASEPRAPSPPPPPVERREVEKAEEAAEEPVVERSSLWSRADDSYYYQNYR